MKHLRTLFTLLLCVASIGGLMAQQGYEIDVTVKGLQQAEAYLAYYYGDKQYLKDTAQVENGRFVFTGEEPIDGGIYLVVLPPDNKYFEVIIDRDQKFSMVTDMENFVGNMQVSGSEENKIFYDDIQYLGNMRGEVESIQKQMAEAKGTPREKELQAQLDDLNKSVVSRRKKIVEDDPEYLYSKVISAMQEPEIPEAPVDENGKPLDSLFAFHYYRAHFFDNIDLADDRLLRTPLFHQKVDQYLEKLTYRHPDSLAKSIDYIIEKTRTNDEVFQYTVISLLNKYAKSPVMGYDALYVHMVEKYYLSGDAHWTDEETLQKMKERALAISPTLIGNKAPNFYVQDLYDNTVSLHGTKGEHTILFIWDYDCGHCKKTMPKLVKAFSFYEDYDVKLLTLSINGDVGVWKEKMETYGLDKLDNAVNCQDHRRQSGFDAMYDVRSTPRLFLLDEDKKILAKQITVGQLQDLLDLRLEIDRPDEEKIEDEPRDQEEEEAGE